jgi:hypothetical protein
MTLVAMHLGCLTATLQTSLVLDLSLMLGKRLFLSGATLGVMMGLMTMRHGLFLMP